MKIDRIFFPVDLSASSHEMNADVECLANHYQAKVTLLHVFGFPITWYAAGEASVVNPDCFKNYEDCQRANLSEYPINVPSDRLERILLEGDVESNIKTLALEQKADLVVLGTHGYGLLPRLLSGSIAVRVLRDLDCPIWVHPAKASFQSNIRRIVCSVEALDESVYLLRYAQQVATDFDAQISLFHCISGAEKGHRRQGDPKISLRAKIAEIQREAETDFPLTVTSGCLAHNVAEAAATQNADVILVGRGKSHNVLGTLRSNLCQILSEAPCPVLSYAHPGLKSET